MKQVTIRIATREDSRAIAPLLRRADVLEVSAFGQTPYEAVEFSRMGSDVAWTVWVEGRLTMMFGVRQPLTADAAEVWALGTDVCTELPREMLWYGRRIVGGLLTKYPVMTNMCDARYTAAHRWLKRLGFHVGEPEPAGIKNEPFCRITIKTEDRTCAL